MAKTTTRYGGSGSSKIRFIMLEADLHDGDLNQITSAITSALKPAPVMHKLISAAPPVVSTPDLEEAVDVNAVDEAVEEEVSESGPSRQRKFRTPKVLDVDLNSGEVPFETFATQKNPSNNSQKYAVVAYWFKRYRSVEGVSQDHVFTCFKRMTWSTAISDFSAPLRNLAGRQYGYGEMKSGCFHMNHVGEAAVEKLGTTAK